MRKSCLFTIVFIFIALPVSMYLGYKISEHGQSDLYYKLRRLEQIIADTLFGSGDAQINDASVRTSSITSELLELTLSARKMSNARSELDATHENTGGALTVVNQQLLFMDPLGKFYLGTSLSESFKYLDIEVPDTNFDRYMFYKRSKQYAGTTFQETPLKYNDLLFLNYKNKQRIFLSYTEFDEQDPCFRNVIATVEFQGSIEFTTINSTDWDPVYRSDPCLPLVDNGNKAMFGEMAGGKLLYEAPSTLYLSAGDFEYMDIAQDQQAEYGKIIKIDIDSLEKSIYASGLRNPKGIIFDSNSQILELENGPRGGDELNIVKSGDNFGWPIETYGTTYFGGETIWSTSFGRHELFKKPFFSWVPSIAPSEIILIENLNPYWDGDLLVSSLRTESLFRIRIAEDRVVYVEPIYIGSRIRDMVIYGNQLVLYTDSMDLIFISTDKIKIYENLSSRYLDNYTKIDINRFNTVISDCQQCHSFFGNDNSQAPNLQNVYLDKAASTPYQGYSPSLKESNKVWTKEMLKRFLRNPQEVVPGTTMPNPGLKEEIEIEAVIGFLEFLDSQV